jgi:hypothetical protein
MKKKVAVLLLACLCAFSLSYGLLAYAEQTGSEAPSKEISGKLVAYSTVNNKLTLTTATGEHAYDLAKSVWVYRDQNKAVLTDLQAGDQIEAVMNSKNQAAYIKAYTEQGLAAKAAANAAPAAAATVSPSSVPSESPSATPEAAPTATPAPTAAEAPQVSATPDALEQLAVTATGINLRLDIKKDRRVANVLSEVKIDAPDKTKLRIKGDAAEDVIRGLLANVNLQSPTAERDLANLIAAYYNLDPAQIKVNLDIKWRAVQPAATVKPAQTAKPDDDDKGNAKLKVSNNAQDRGDDHGKNEDNRGKGNGGKQSGKDKEGRGGHDD